MKYIETLFMRKRTFQLDKYGINIEDSGLFRTINRFIKLENIAPKYNFHKESIIDKVILSISLLSLSVYIFLNHNTEIIFLMIGTIFTLFSLFILFDSIKNSNYKGTLSFKSHSGSRDGTLYFKTNYPINKDLQNFIEKIREFQIDKEYLEIIENKFHKSIQKQYRYELKNLKSKLFISDEEFYQLNKQLELFFEENEIQESLDNV